MSHFMQRLFRLYRDSFTGLPRSVWMLAIVLLVNRSGAMVVTFLSVYLVNAEGYNPTKAGFVMMAFGAGGIVGNYVGGLLNDKFGSWHIMLFSMIIAGLLNISLGQVHEFWALCLLAFLISVSADAFRPASRAALSHYAPEGRLTQSFGLLRLAVNLGLAIGPAVGGYMIYNYGYGPMFWADGITFLLAAGVFVLVLPKDATAQPLSKRSIPKIINQEDKVANSDESLSWTPPAHKALWMVLFAFANASIILCFFQLLSTMPVYLRGAGYDEQSIGYIFTLNGLLIVAVEMPLLFLTEKRFRMVPVMLIGAGFIAVSYMLLGVGEPTLLMLIVMIVIVTFGEILYMPFTNTYVSKFAPPQRLGEYQGTLSASYSTAFVLAPLIGFGVAEKYGYQASFIVCALMAGLGILLLSRLDHVRENQKLNLQKEATLHTYNKL